MFDIGFWELTVIGVVALLVIGPERLPRVARTAGLWLGRARRFVGTVKADIDREIAADELKKTLARQAETSGLYDVVEDTRQTIAQVKESVSATTGEAEESQDTASDSGQSPEAKTTTQKSNGVSG
jgi:sec-independent protein translocase protein TatB